MDVVLGLLLGENLLKWGGGLEEGGQKFDLTGGGRIYLMALKAWQALCFKDIRRKTGSPVRGSVQASFRGTFRDALWKLFGFFLEPFGRLGATFGRLFVNFRSFGGSF